MGIICFSRALKIVVMGMNLNRFCYLLLALAAIGSLLTLHSTLMWFLLANLLTLIIYGADKMAARKAWRRVPESTLLVFGIVGGWPGAIVGQQLFRHKTQKQPFKTYFIISVILNVIALGEFITWLPLHANMEKRKGRRKTDVEKMG